MSVGEIIGLVLGLMALGGLAVVLPQVFKEEAQRRLAVGGRRGNPALPIATDEIQHWQQPPVHAAKCTICGQPSDMIAPNEIHGWLCSGCTVTVEKIEASTFPGRDLR